MPKVALMKLRYIGASGEFMQMSAAAAAMSKTRPPDAGRFAKARAER